MSDPIKKDTRPDSSTFYWFRISAGRHPVTGKRVQVYKSFDSRREAKAEYGRILSDLASKRFVARDGITVSAYLDRWSLPTGATSKREAGRSSIMTFARSGSGWGSASSSQ
jgi:hypothetical protein